MPSFTRKVILSTFNDLLETTPFEKITVSAIIKASGISRNTFYYHFRDIYDLLDNWLRMKLGQYESAEEGETWEEQIKALLHSCVENKRRVYHLYDSISRGRMEQFVFSSTNDLVSAYVRAYAEGRNVPPQRIDAVVDICRYAIIGFFLHFLWNGMTADIDKSVDELSVVYNDIVRGTLRSDEGECAAAPHK